MGSSCVVGLQWGDEAKGKVVDLLCDQHDAVVRYQGGANAGHTVVVGSRTYRLSLVPSGFLRPEIDCVLGNGVVIHPATLVEELAGLEQQGVPIGRRLHISDRAHVILPYHLIEERLTEESTSQAERLGTTLRGIGPCYRDKVGRVHGVRMGDLLDPPRFRDHLSRIIPYKNRLLSAMLPDYQALDVDAVADEYVSLGERLAPYIVDTTVWLHEAMGRGRRLLFEGAQGTLLDIDHGSYPYVTSSNSSATGLASGSGVPARRIDRWIGVVKAYTTRVGGGPFPTELDNAIGEQIRQKGREFGTVTGRSRRCGWFDAVAARHALRISGSTELAVMLLDVLSGLETIQVAVGYINGQGRQIDHLPARLDDWASCQPIFETLPGWSDELTEVSHWNDLPRPARDYVTFLGDQLGVPISIVSVGPDRRQTILVEPSA